MHRDYGVGIYMNVMKSVFDIVSGNVRHIQTKNLATRLQILLRDLKFRIRNKQITTKSCTTFLCSKNKGTVAQLNCTFKVFISNGSSCIDMSSQTSTILLKPEEVHVSVELQILYRLVCIFMFKQMVVNILPNS